VADPLAHTTTYGYDLAGNLTSILDANGHSTTLAYDELNRLSQKTWPDSSFEGFGYDSVGNQTSHRLADGNTNNFAYDVTNRLSQISYFDGQNVSFAYTADSQRQSVTDSRGVTQYQYDHRGRVTQITLPNGQTVSYTYDAAGNRLTLATLAGTVSYSYDAANQLTGVTDPQHATSTLAYDPVGLRTKLSLPNGVTVDYSYDALNRLTNIVQKHGATTLASYSYTLGAAGNRTGVTEADGSAFQWGYDDAYHLTEEKRLDSSNATVSDTSFAYDATGNRLSQTVNGVTTNYTYNNLDQLLSDGTATYGYDGRGNLTSITSGANVTTYGYDAADRLISVVLPDNTAVNNKYDADGRKVKQTVGADVTNYLWDEESLLGDVILETDGNGTPIANYLLGTTELLSETRSGATSYYLQDGQASTRTLTSSTGSVTNRYSYDAFGSLLSHQGTAINPYLYTGQQFDDVTGLYSLRARYFAPGLGRFLSRDMAEVSVDHPNELNRYVYTANNPINTFDPLGQNFIRPLA